MNQKPHPGMYNGEFYVQGPWFIYWPDKPFIYFGDPNAVIASKADQITYKEANDELLNLVSLKELREVLQKYPPKNPK